MTLSEMERVALTVDEACAAVIDRPADTAARAGLFELLAPLANASFHDGDFNVKPRVFGLFRQASSFAAIVRARIDNARTDPESFVAMQVAIVARDLQRIVSQVLGEFAKGRDA
jgi:hypothetical protein